MLTFDEDNHRYYWGGLSVPGVTSILSPLGGYEGIPARILETAANFGKAVHLACELDDLGELDTDVLDPQLLPYLEGWRAFSRDYAVQWEAIEVPGFHPTLGYAGTPDRRGMVRGLRAVVDIKTTAKLMPTVGPQLAAYEHLAISGGGMDKRYGVQLRADGTYHCQEYTDPLDWPLFCSLLTVRNWCARHDLTPKLKD